MAIREGNQLFKLWLTRRFSCLFLLQLKQVTKNDPLVNAQNEVENREQIMAFQKENSKVQHSIDATETNLQQLTTEHPTLLATAISVDKQTLILQCQEDKKLTLELTTTLAYSMLRLMEAALSGTEWGLVATDCKFQRSPEQDAANTSPFHLN